MLELSTLEAIVQAILLLPDTATAESFIAVLPSPIDKVLCFGTKEELVEGLKSEFWKDRGSAALAAIRSVNNP